MGFNFDLNPQNFNFNAQNFVLGLLTGWLTAYALYRARHFIGAARESVSERALTAQEFAARNADARYIRDLIKYCEAAHLAGAFVPLSSLVVEPRFIRAPKIATLSDDDEGLGSVFHVIPHIPDHPYLQAPYNIETLSLEELDNGARNIALLGVPGSGRSTTLHAIALWSLGRVKFDPPLDKVQEKLEQEESALSSEERARRIKQRMDVQNTIRQGKGAEAEASTLKQAGFRQLTPIYAHMGNITLSTNEFGRRIDPAEPLLRAAQQYVGRVTSMTLAGNLYERLAEGKALLLLDGFDDLPQGEQQAKGQWLKALIAEYGHNFIIVSGPVNGYGALLQAGLTPVFLRPWQDTTLNRSLEQWAKAWPKIGGARRRGVKAPDERVISIARQDNRVRSPFELTLKTWTAYHQDGEAADPATWIDTLLAYALPNKTLDDIKPQLVQLARLQLEKGYITESQLAHISKGGSLGDLPEAAGTAPESPEDTSFLDEQMDDDDFLEDDNEAGQPINDDDDTFADVAPAPSSKPQKPAAKAKENQKAEREYEKFIVQLYKAGLLLRYRGNRYQFRHPLIAAYFSGMALHDMPLDELLQKADAPQWQAAFAYAAAHTSLDAVVNTRLQAPADVLHDNIVQMAPWLAHVPPKTRWRAEVLTALGNMFLAQHQYTLIRERAAAALVSTRDANALKVFEKGLKDKNPDVRHLACLGVGALQDADSLLGLLDLMDNDPNVNVRLAAGLAVSILGTEDALQEIALTLAQVDEQTELLGRALAEQFAANPEEGYPLLYEATTHENMFLRRAAVFGLRRIPTPWATVAIYTVSVEDKQAYVKLAAESVFYDAEFTDGTEGVRAYPEVMRLPWLRSWILSRGVDELELENLPTGENAAEYLMLALKEAPDDLKAICLTNIGQLGFVGQTGALYDWLGDRNRDMREAAHRALSDLQMQIGRGLPLPH